ncbi:MAG: flavodoxin family protein [Oscillospiraceae bacterium]
MKVLLVNGSPHRAGCTYTALHEVAAALGAEGIETEIFWIGAQPISGCMACGYCSEHGKCAFDDCVNLFAQKAKETDGFIFGSPVHYASASGAMTSFMDRLFYSTPAEVFRHKPAGVIVSARRAGTTAAYEQLIKYPGISEMPIISSHYWNMVHGSRAEDVIKDKEGMQSMRILGRNMAYYLKCIEAGKKAGVSEPPHENRDATNFIR